MARGNRNAPPAVGQIPPDLRQGESRATRGDDHVVGQRYLASARGRQAVDGGDQWLSTRLPCYAREAAFRGRDGVFFIRAVGLSEMDEIMACAKYGAAFRHIGAQNAGADLRVALNTVDCGLQGRGHGGVNCVALLRTIERNNTDPADHLEEDHLGRFSAGFRLMANRTYRRRAGQGSLDENLRISPKRGQAAAPTMAGRWGDRHRRAEPIP